MKGKPQPTLCEAIIPDDSLPHAPRAKQRMTACNLPMYRAADNIVACQNGHLRRVYMTDNGLRAFLKGEE